MRRHGRLHPLPEGLTGLVPTNLDAFQKTELLSDAGKARLAAEAEAPKLESNEDESVASFISRRMGRETYENLVEPLMSGIYAGDGEQMSILSTFPQLRQVEAKHGSLLSGLTQNGPTAPPKYPPFVSFENGIAELVEALLERLEGVDIYLDSRVEKVARGGTAEAQGKGNRRWQLKVEDESFAADSVILTTPAWVNAELLGDIDQDLAATMGEIPYAGTVLVNVAVADTMLDLPDGYGYVIPRAEKRNVLACTWSSQKWFNRAPDGRALLRVYIGRYGEDDVCSWTDGELIELARNELKAILDLPEGAKQMYLVVRWPKGLPQYTLGHLERLARIEERLTHHLGLLVAGAAYRGVGIPDCIKSAEAVVKATIQIFSHKNQRAKG